MQVFNSPCMNDVWTNLLFEGQTQGKLRKTGSLLQRYMSIHLGQIKFKTLDCDPCRSGDFVYSADVKSTLCRAHFDSQKVAL